MGEEDPSDDGGFFERNKRRTNDTESVDWPLSRRKALQLGLAAGVPLVGAAGTRTLGRSTTDPLLSPGQWEASVDPPVATRRQVSSVGPIFSHSSLLSSGPSWKAYEHIDTELYHYYALPLNDLSYYDWAYFFDLRSVAIQTREFADGSVELFERTRPSHELTVELYNVGDIRVTEAGLLSPGQLEESLSELRSQTTDGEQPGFPAALHKTADIADRIDEATEPQRHQYGGHWPISSLSAPKTGDADTSSVQAVDEDRRQNVTGKAEDIRSSFSLSGTLESGSVVGSAAQFAVYTEAPMEGAPSLSITAQYGSAPRERTQEWDITLESFPRLSKTEEYAFGRDELEHWPLLSHRDIGRNAIDADAIDNQTMFPFGDVVAEDTGWTTAPIARPDPTIRRISGTAASQPPDSQLQLTFKNPGEQWDPRWFFFGSGVQSGYQYSEHSDGSLDASDIQPGRIHVGVQVDDRHRLSGLGELEFTVADAELTGATSISDRSVTLRAEVAHPEPRNTETGSTVYRATFQYVSDSATEYQTGATVESSGTGRSMLATVTGLEPETQYSCKVTLEEVSTYNHGTVMNSTTLVESEPLTVLTKP